MKLPARAAGYAARDEEVSWSSATTGRPPRAGSASGSKTCRWIKNQHPAWLGHRVLISGRRGPECKQQHHEPCVIDVPGYRPDEVAACARHFAGRGKTRSILV